MGMLMSSATLVVELVHIHMVNFFEVLVWSILHLTTFNTGSNVCCLSEDAGSLFVSTWPIASTDVADGVHCGWPLPCRPDGDDVWTRKKAIQLHCPTRLRRPS